MIDTDKYEELINTVCLFIHHGLEGQPAGMVDKFLSNEFRNNVDGWLKENTHFHDTEDLYIQMVDTFEWCNEACGCTDAMLKEHGAEKVPWLEGRLWYKKIHENAITSCKKCYPQEVIE